MKKIFFVIIITIISILGTTQANNIQPEILYGAVQKADLERSPYNEWFNTGYSNYQPSQEIIEKLKRQITSDTRIEVFFGTWCGDSRRELPRLLKILDEISFPAKNLQLIGVGGSDSLIKQSPGHEEEGKGIFRVPTIIVYQKGKETKRINEYPCSSLENDLYAILSHQSYEPSYKSFALIKKWMDDGSLLNKNISAKSLASQLRALTEGEYELSSLAHLLLKQGKMREALKLFQVNYNLYPESARVVSSLGEGYFKTGDTVNAVISLEKALELNKDPKIIKEILVLLYEAKGVK